MSHSVVYTRASALHDALLPQGPCVQLRSTHPSSFFPFRSPYAGGGHAGQMSGARASQAPCPCPCPSCTDLSLEQKYWLQVPLSHLRQPSLWQGQIKNRKSLATSPGGRSLNHGNRVQPGHRFLCCLGWQGWFGGNRED